MADCLAKPDPCRERTTRRKDDGPMSNTSMGSGGVDPAAIAQSELAANTVPTPEDVLADVSPLTQLWYARETCYAAMRVMTATLSVGDDEALPDDSEPVRALSALSEACGTLDGACTLVGLLPEDYASANG